METKKKTREHRYPRTTKNLKNFLVEGYITPIQLSVYEFTQACSEAQARRDIHIRLRERHRTIVIPPLKDYCSVKEVPFPRTPTTTN